MDITLETVQAQAMQLGPQEREQLIERLLASLGDAGLEAAWEAELDRREAAVDAGLEDTIPMATVLAELRARVPA
ncbi:MAG: addiction module protein [Roseateles sp.]|uniref:addiction module protein n=1 Tax=Roseateles sp. TaxID=1971397 RepID=UPI0039ED0DB3